MEALVITGGESPAADFLFRLAERAGIVIAADSGYDVARQSGINPDYIVGDFDSIADSASLEGFPQENIHRYPSAKDDTDTEIAIALARKLGAGRIVLAGGGGGRLDHLLALSYLFLRPDPPAEWHTGSESVFFLPSKGRARCRVEPGSCVSVLPAGGRTSRGMSSKGLAWPLEGLSWAEGQVGISNRSLSTEIEVGAGDADLLLLLASGSECLLQ
jgi:thiamine pyrophosphokinase